MTTTEKISHKLGANRDETARKQRRPRRSSESRDVREDRSERQSKFSHAQRSVLAPRGNIPCATAAGRIPGPEQHLLTQHASGPSTKPAHLRLFRSGARSVSVAETFNHWEPQTLALQPDSDGGWNINLSLAPGDYEYRFVVDGVWIDDPLACRVVANPYGGVNAVLHVHGG